MEMDFKDKIKKTFHPSHSSGIMNNAVLQFPCSLRSSDELH